MLWPLSVLVANEPKNTNGRLAIPALAGLLVSYSLALHSTPPLGSSHRNSTTPFGVEKLEWLGYPMVKKFRRYLYSFWRNSRT